MFYIFYCIFLAAFFYLYMPSISYNIFSSIFFLIICSLPLLFRPMFSRKNQNYYGEQHRYRRGIFLDFKVFWFLAIIFSFSASMIISSLSCFRANDYKNLLPVPKQESLAKKIQAFDNKIIPSVNADYAEKLADKVIGQDLSLGSRAHMGKLTLQYVNGNLYYVAPMLHSGFLKWINNKSTPGYIMVNANDDRDVKFVTQINNKPINIVYQPEAFFNQNLERKIYFSGNMLGVGITDFTFEIDDQGKPYWTASIYKNTIGFNGTKIVGTAVVDAQTGKVKNYSIENTPNWIDRIQPVETFNDNLDFYGKYQHGFWNFATGKDQFRATKGTGMIYNNGKCYYYTGITSKGEDDSTMGFILSDSRTMETFIFRISGATESAAMTSAEGKVQNLNYTASFPILTNINNIPTYFLTLNDKSKLTKLYAMVSVGNYNIIGTGESVDECRDNYMKLLSTNKSGKTTSSGEVKTIDGEVLKIGQYIQGSSSYYNILLKDNSNIFNAGVSISPKLPLTSVGDKVKIKYTQIPNISTMNVEKFDNLSIK